MIDISELSKAGKPEEEPRKPVQTLKPILMDSVNPQAKADPSSLFHLELVPDNFRAGNRNKKLDTLMMNGQGIVVAGSSTGELLVWRLNYEMIKRR